MGHPSVAIANGINYCVPCVPQCVLATTTIVAGPTKLQASQTYFRSATLMALKNKDGTPNSGDVAIGPSSTNGEQPIVLQPGDSYVLAAPIGAKWDFQDWYLVVASNDDGVVIIYS